MLIDTDDPNIMWKDWRAKFLVVADIHVTRKVRNDYVNKLNKHMKATYYMNAFKDCESNPKETWKKISDLTNERPKPLIFLK